MICAEVNMAKSSQSSARSFKLRYATDVTVRVPEFQLLSSLQYLDADSLSLAAKARVDIGFFKSPCCDRHVRAVIERGIVVGLEMAPCSDATALPPGEVAFVAAALKRVRRSGGKWKPVAVKEFLATAEQRVNGETNCIEFTIFGRTIFCCRTDEGPISCVFVGPITVNRL
jgi:hypothetical protein